MVCVHAVPCSLSHLAIALDPPALLDLPARPIRLFQQSRLVLLRVPQRSRRESELVQIDLAQTVGSIVLLAELIKQRGQRLLLLGC